MAREWKKGKNYVQIYGPGDDCYVIVLVIPRRFSTEKDETDVTRGNHSEEIFMEGFETSQFFKRIYLCISVIIGEIVKATLVSIRLCLMWKLLKSTISVIIFLRNMGFRSVSCVHWNTFRFYLLFRYRENYCVCIFTVICIILEPRQESGRTKYSWKSQGGEGVEKE